MSSQQRLAVSPNERVRNVATPAPVYLRETMRAGRVRTLFVERGVVWAPVLDAQGWPVGSVHLRDLSEFLAGSDLDTAEDGSWSLRQQARVERIMRPSPQVIDERSPLRKAASIWELTEPQPLVVVDAEGTMVGTLSPEDLDRAATVSFRPRVLVADDDRAIREVLGDVLTEEGYEVSLAENGEAALAALRRSPPDVMVLDLMMPVMSGWELLQKMEQGEGDVDEVPVIVISAFKTCVAEVQERAVRARFEKPIDLAGLLEALHTCRIDAEAPRRLL